MIENQQQKLQAFHVMAKPTGSRCNLDCEYCFFLKKEALYPDSNFCMSDAVMESYIRQTIEAHKVPDVTIAWQGGEPTLMGLDFFEQDVVVVFPDGAADDFAEAVRCQKVEVQDDLFIVAVDFHVKGLCALGVVRDEYGFVVHS